MQTYAKHILQRTCRKCQRRRKSNQRNAGDLTVALCALAFPRLIGAHSAAGAYEMDEVRQGGLSSHRLTQLSGVLNPCMRQAAQAASRRKRACIGNIIRLSFSVTKKTELLKCQWLRCMDIVRQELISALIWSQRLVRKSKGGSS